MVIFKIGLESKEGYIISKMLRIISKFNFGHHFDDQAETLFMRIIKGSALDGLSGMNEITSWNGIFIIRPLLSYKKNRLKIM